MKLLFILLYSVSCTAHSSTGARHDKYYIKNLIMLEAITQGVPVDLAISVATVESSLNPNAVGSKGELGLFQLLPSHIRSGSHASTRELIKEGIKEIKYWQTHCPTKENYTYVICYNGGFRHPKYPYFHPYYTKVMQAMR